MSADLLKEWRDLIEREARAAAEAVLRERAGEVEAALSEARQALADADGAKARAESSAALVESLSEILKRAPREMFLSDADLALVMQIDGHGQYRDSYDLVRQIDWLSRQPATLIQRHATMLPKGRYAVVISFHRIDGGGK